MRSGGRAWARYIVEVRKAGIPSEDLAADVLARELGLLAYRALAEATAEIAGWRQKGYRVVSMVDPDYPDNLRVIENRPPLLFVAGDLRPADRSSVAVIGTRNPSALGCELAVAVAGKLAAAGYPVFSGLASGIDTCVHNAVLARSRRTVAVVGTGLDHVYPAENAELQRRIAAEGAVISQFWPESRPTRQSFRIRNALMSGITLGSVIVEASPTSGTRVQARHALAQGRQLILMAPVLANDWASQLVEQQGVSVAETVDDVFAALRA